MLITQCTIYRFPLFARIKKYVASKLFDEIDIFSEKMSVKRRRKIDELVDIIGFAWNNAWAMNTCFVLEWE